MFLNFSLYAEERINELVYVHLDKDCYIAGEDIWVKFCVVDQYFQASSLSKVGYVEICDVQKPYIQKKLALINGQGTGKISIPATIPSGIYELTGYTRYMKNRDIAFRREIAIVNMFEMANQDRIDFIETVSEIKSREKETSLMDLSTDKPLYTNREKVTVSIDATTEIDNLVISVSRNDTIEMLNPLNKANWQEQLQSSSSLLSEIQWAPEYEGHILEGQITGSGSEIKREINYDLLSADMGIVGRDIGYTKGQIDSQSGRASFYTSKIYGIQDMVTSVNSLDDTSYRIDIQSPYSGKVAESLSQLCVQKEDSSLMERYIGVQLRQIMFEDSLGHRVPIENYYALPIHVTYDLDEYTRFDSMDETFVEFVKRIIVRRVDGERRLKVLMEGKGFKFNAGNTLVLLDGVPLHNHEQLLSYNPHAIKYIYIYGGKYVFGGDVFDCMVSFVTYRRNLSHIQLPANYQLISYDFPELPEYFETPSYETEENKTSRKPDFRHTLYWEPSFKLDNNISTVSFYTSDLKGEFKIVAEGITKEGKIIRGVSFFEVK